MTMRMIKRALVSILLFLVFLVVLAEGRKKPKNKKQMQTQETSIFNFLRLVIVRLVYGFASMMGFSESLSDFLGGAFVPPGVDPDDYGDYGGEDDY